MNNTDLLFPCRKPRARNLSQHSGAELGAPSSPAPAPGRSASSERLTKMESNPEDVKQRMNAKLEGRDMDELRRNLEFRVCGG